VETSRAFHRALEKRPCQRPESVEEWVTDIAIRLENTQCDVSPWVLSGPTDTVNDTIESKRSGYGGNATTIGALPVKGDGH
jgi:hypothetical protein